MPGNHTTTAGNYCMLLHTSGPDLHDALDVDHRHLTASTDGH